MQILDYCTLVDPDLPPAGTATAVQVYQRGYGVQFRSADRAREYFHERVNLSDRAFLFVTDSFPDGDDGHRQIVSDQDWIHIQFRIAGGGFESISGLVMETPEQSCIVSRYPKNSIIDRTVQKAGHWRYACLYASPKGLMELLDIQSSGVPEESRWLIADGQGQEFRSSTLPIQSRMVMSVQDVLSCPFRSISRRAYMRSKALELLSTLIHVLEAGTERRGGAGIGVSAADAERLARARDIMTENLESNLTLAELARRVSLNRTKLAVGFKAIYGISVQAYWRDAKLSRARELLMQPNARITEVALSLGYSELSSFTRAFTRKFGFLPREYRKIARAAS